MNPKRTESGCAINVVDDRALIQGSRSAGRRVQAGAAPNAIYNVVLTEALILLHCEEDFVCSCLIFSFWLDTLTALTNELHLRTPLRDALRFYRSSRRQATLLSFRNSN